MVTIHEKERGRQAMAQLARVHRHETKSTRVDGVFMIASARLPAEDEAIKEGSYWTCYFHRDARDAALLVVPYSMGSAHRSPPTCDDVLSCLCKEAQGYDDAQDFEDWASWLDYDTDSRKAERMYRQTSEQAKGLRRLLGQDYERIVDWGAREWDSED